MRWMKNSKNSILIILVCFFSTSMMIKTDNTDNHLLSWAFIKRDITNNADTATCANDIVLKPHQRFKFVLQPGRKSFVYLFYLSDKGEFKICFPDNFAYPRSWAKDVWYDIPAGIFKWFRVVETSVSESPDTYYLLASAKPLRRLDSLVKKFFKEQTKADEIKKKILDEIFLLIIENSIYTPEKIEIPVPIGGSIKGDINETLDVFKIKDLSFYAKVINIRLESPGK